MDFQLWPRKNESISISLGPKEISFMHNIEGCFYESILRTNQLVTKTNLSLLRLKHFHLILHLIGYQMPRIIRATILIPYSSKYVDFWIW